MSREFQKILIANRGEIACRIAKTVQKMGLSSTAVFTPGEERFRHVEVADEAHPMSSYTNIEEILSVAKKSGADAIHPGYGYLSENQNFAKRCEEEGIRFIGPSTKSMIKLSDKKSAKVLARSAGVPCVPGFELEPGQTVKEAQTRAFEVGFPLMIKATSGGGGRGMRWVKSADDFEEEFLAASREGEATFGNAQVLVERAIEKARHIEVQVIADQHGNVVCLGTRDCSVQRRHQKVIEEAPAFALSEDIAESMYSSASSLVKASNYINAGTVEFLLEGDDYYFLEMNTRLQVEHPVTEAVYGVDLVEWQIRVAQGESLESMKRHQKPKGHSIELRICAENEEFVPQVGRARGFNLPEGPGVRVDHGLNAHFAVLPAFDSLVAKLIVTEETREKCIQSLLAAIDGFQLRGIETNLNYLREIVQTDNFAAMDFDTKWLEKQKHLQNQAKVQKEELACAVILFYLRGQLKNRYWQGWPGSLRAKKIRVGWRQKVFDFEVQPQSEGKYQLKLSTSDNGEDVFEVEASISENFHMTIRGAGIETKTSGTWDVEGETLFVHFKGRSFEFVDKTYDYQLGEGLKGAGIETASMDGKIVKMAVQKGKTYQKGQLLYVLEAMKMQHQIKAPEEIKVLDVLVGEGDQVRSNQQIFDLEMNRTE